ncbi:MAG: hypothetical protein ABFR47_00985 [Verrucomicrobiota bacterium]
MSGNTGTKIAILQQVKTYRIVLFLLLGAIASLSSMDFLHPSADASVKPETIGQPGENPSAENEDSNISVVPKQPVQPIEERGDAMLFECEALVGTPFDQEITMPFD